MYIKGNPVFEAHKKYFGDQKVFGYKELIPLFKPDKFDADEWADLFAASGAKFAGPVAIHHDNYAMWDSTVNPWNSVRQAPKQDFPGKLEKAIKARDMKFITTFHHSYTWEYFRGAYQYDAADKKNIELYGEIHKEGEWPTQRFLDTWLEMINEVVTQYEPDLIWFDFALSNQKCKCITPEYRKKMFADYYNWAAANNKQVGVAHKHWDIHEHAGIIDFERGRLDEVTPYVWLTDTSVGPWFHDKSAAYKTVNQLVDVLVDIVSKNGCMLLNVDPKMDGTIPQQSKDLLLGIGQWLKVNGEAIYATRPLEIFGEGPSKMEKSGGFSENNPIKYTADDIRFTQSKDGKTVYVIVLDWPDRPVTIQSLTFNTAKNSKIELLGQDGNVDFSVGETGRLTLKIPYRDPEHSLLKHAYVFKLTDFDVSTQKQKSTLQKELKLAFITCAKDAKFFVPVKKGMNDAAAMLGVHCDFMGTEGVDIPAQAKMVSQAVEDGYDGIALNIIDPEAFDDVVEKAINAGVPVVAFNVDDQGTPNARLSSVNQRLYDAGKSLGEHVLPRIPSGSHVLMTMHDEGVSALEDRLHGMQEALKEKNIKWTVIISGNDSGKGAEVIANALKANPDIRAVLGTGQADTEAAGMAIEQYFSGKGYWSAGFDLSPKTLQLIQDGVIDCTVDQQPYIQGFYPVVQLTHYLRYGIVPSNIDAGAAIVDTSNVQTVVELTKQNYR